ncbi:MAG: transporter associated domain-containing protein [Succinivibrionaceae bacterium]|nr:transporter associated domain-containing protein [Succinivibrionaceae bacterium]
MSSDERDLQNSTTPNEIHHHPKNWIKKISNILKGEPNDKEELADIISGAGDREIIDEDTQDMIEGVFEISELRVRDIMIPRSQMVTISSETPINEVITNIIESGHSRYPVIHNDKDHIEGILLAKDLLKVLVNQNTYTLKELTRPAVVVPESKRVDRLLKEFQQCRYHMAIVIDEYGGVSGLVTIEDILELIVGEIEDEYDNDEIEKENITKVGTNVYHILSLTPIEEFNEKFGTNYADNEYDTIGGMVLHAFGHLPTKGDTISIDNLDFKVLSADKRCTHTLQMVLNPKIDEE